MIVDILIQFANELLRALLVDELSERVRRNIRGAAFRRHERRRKRFYFHLSRRNTRRLLHKLRTDEDAPVR